MWTIDKQFDFCYAHRVWSQQLEKTYCSGGDVNCKCRFIHGHQAKVHVFAESDQLTRGMVTDFKHLGFLKDFFEDYIDHKFILDLNDPWFVNIINAQPIFHDEVLQYLDIQQDATQSCGPEILSAQQVPIAGTSHLMGYCLDVDILEGPAREFFEGFFLVNFLPTSENLSRWIADGAAAKLKQLGVKVSRVEWFETPKSRSTYIME